MSPVNMYKYVFGRTDMFRSQSLSGNITQGRFSPIFVIHIEFESDLINCFGIYYSQHHIYPTDKAANLFTPVHLAQSTDLWDPGFFNFSLTALYVRKDPPKKTINSARLLHTNIYSQFILQEESSWSIYLGDWISSSRQKKVVEEEEDGLIIYIRDKLRFMRGSMVAEPRVPCGSHLERRILALFPNALATPGRTVRTYMVLYVRNLGSACILSRLFTQLASCQVGSLHCNRFVCISKCKRKRKNVDCFRIRYNRPFQPQFPAVGV